ncbi:lipase chaperone [Vibrio makurazakiensis]|uniref:lipase secretion chaperone n=1 Tax=Vibrio makurazakiensis TaxID=2910250 RepID=UPI003D0FCA1E
MKKTTLLFTFLIASVMTGAVFYLSSSQPDQVSESLSSMKVDSQKDTEIDESSAKDTMEYFMSGLVELELESVENNVSNFQKSNPNSQITPELFAKYAAYKAALKGVDVPSGYSSLGLNELMDIHHQLLALQLQFFTAEEQALLFEHDNRMRELALEKLRLQEDGLDTEEFQQQWQSMLAQQPEYVQESQKNLTLLNQLTQTESLSEQERYLSRAQLVDEEAVERLDELDEKRQKFDTDLNEYLESRVSILDDPSLSPELKTELIASLRSSTFSAQQLKRVQALERIHDASL